MTCKNWFEYASKNIVCLLGCRIITKQIAISYLSIWSQSQSKSMERMFGFKKGFYFHEQEGYGNLRGDNFYMHES